MEWSQVLTVVGANFAAFMWSRKEASEDRKQFLTILQAIQAEIKDFHGRLCSIEAKRERKHIDPVSQPKKRAGRPRKEKIQEPE